MSNAPRSAIKLRPFYVIADEQIKHIRCGIFLILHTMSTKLIKVSAKSNCISSDIATVNLLAT